MFQVIKKQDIVAKGIVLSRGGSKLEDKLVNNLLDNLQKAEQGDLIQLTREDITAIRKGRAYDGDFRKGFSNSFRQSLENRIDKTGRKLKLSVSKDKDNIYLIKA